MAPTAFLAAGLLGSVYLWNTDPHEPGHLLPGCPFRALTGWQCPACGTTRLAYDLMHGDVARAWHDNALLLLLSPVLLWLLLGWLVAGLRGHAFRVHTPRWVLPALLPLGLGWAVLRNVA
ncbi:MAG TPA: DUF2752 domain-containing protein [Mycobacteriales bacterium]|nr:DUF2752 domain-containing protein [Mycobacteriales bacterium]